MTCLQCRAEFAAGQVPSAFCSDDCRAAFAAGQMQSLESFYQRHPDAPRAGDRVRLR